MSEAGRLDSFYLAVLSLLLASCTVEMRGGAIKNVEKKCDEADSIVRNLSLRL